jgi:uncharacterized protein
MSPAQLREELAAAPTFLDPHTTGDAIELVDGGVWANNPIGVASIEAIGVLNWPADRLKKLPMVTSMARLFMAGQSHSAMGTAKIVTGDVHHRQAIWRIDQTAPLGRYTLDNARRIAEMKNRGFTEAREQLPILRPHFFAEQAEAFVPFHSLKPESDSVGGKKSALKPAA